MASITIRTTDDAKNVTASYTVTRAAIQAAKMLATMTDDLFDAADDQPISLEFPVLPEYTRAAQVVFQQMALGPPTLQSLSELTASVFGNLSPQAAWTVIEYANLIEYKEIVNILGNHTITTNITCSTTPDTVKQSFNLPTDTIFTQAEVEHVLLHFPFLSRANLESFTKIAPS